MSIFELYHDDPLWLGSEILIINHYTTKEFSFCFGLSDIEEPLAGIYKHSLWHFIYFITTWVSVPLTVVNCVTTI